MIIRTATPDDFAAMSEMGQHFLDATPYGECLTATGDSLEAFMGLLAQNESAIMLVADGGAGLVGMVVGWIFPHPFSMQPIASELVWWVKPDARGSVGVRLLVAFEAWAQERGATAIQMIAPHGSGIAALYERRGYRRVEALYQREV